MRDKILVSVAIGDEQAALEAWAVKIDTPSGEFQIGIDNNGNTYLTSNRTAMSISPRASNRVIISQDE